MKKNVGLLCRFGGVLGLLFGFLELFLELLELGFEPATNVLKGFDFFPEDLVFPVNKGQLA